MGNPFLRRNSVIPVLTIVNSVLLFILLGSIAAAALLSYPLLKDHPDLSRLKNRILTVLDLSYLMYAPSGSSLPIYDLRVKPENLKALNDALPLSGKWWVRQGGDKSSYVPAKFSYQGKEYNVKVRYRGDMKPHWGFEKKSWRIQFKGKTLFEGMKGVNLIIPEDRAYFLEEVNNQIAKKLGLLVPRSRFVILRLNGAYQGVYFEIEQWGTEFMERNQRPDMNLYGEEDRDLNLRERGLIDEEIYSDIGFWKKYASDKRFPFENYAELDVLLELLNQGSDEEIKRLLPQLLDLEIFYKWQVHSLLAGSHHQNFWHNLRILFNNRSGKFEIAPWDVLGEETPSVDIHYNPLVTRILSIPEFLHERNLLLWDYLKEERHLAEDVALFDQIFQEVRSAFLADRKKRFSNAQFLEDIKRFRAFFIENRKILKENLEFSRLFANIRYLATGGETRLPLPLAEVEFTSDGYSAARVDRIAAAFNQAVGNLSSLSFYQDRNENRIFDPEDSLVARLEQKSQTTFAAEGLGLMFYSRREGEPTRFDNYKKPIKPRAARYRFFLIAESKAPLVEAGYPELDFQVTHAVTGRPFSPTVHSMDRNTFRHLEETVEDRTAFLEKWPFFVAEGEKGVRWPKGNYEVSENLIIPQGLLVKIDPGVTVRLAPQVSIYSYSPVEAAGNPSEPILFTAQDIQKPWGVFAILNTKRNPNRFEFGTFEYGGEAYVNGIYATGALALHDSDVVIDQCLFRYNTGDDALNIKYGEALVRRSKFAENKYDALDFDFVRGKVSENSFYANGNDGIDLSGSEVQLVENRVELSGDKGVSAGERSLPVLFDNLFVKNHAGIVVKDQTTAKIINNTIVKNKTGIQLYQKKPIFGGAAAMVYNTLIWDNEVNVEVGQGSRLLVDHSDVENGFQGTRVLNLKPVFQNEAEGDFRLKDVEANEGLLRGGSPDPVRELWPGFQDPSVAIGILND